MKFSSVFIFLVFLLHVHLSIARSNTVTDSKSVIYNDSTQSIVHKQFEKYKHSSLLPDLHNLAQCIDSLLLNQVDFDHDVFSQIQSLIKKNKQNKTVEAAYINLLEGDLLFEDDRLENAIKKYKAGIDVLESINKQTTRIYTRILHQIAFTNFNLGNYDEAMLYGPKCIESARLNKIPLYEIKSFVVLSKCLVNSDDLMAVNFAKKGLQLADKYNIESDRQFLYLLMMAQYANSIEDYESAIQYADSTYKYTMKQPGNHAAILNNYYRFKGLAYHFTNQKEQAEQCFNALDSLMKTKDAKKYYYGQSLYATANSYLNTNQFKKAEYYYEEALRDYNKNKPQNVNPLEIYTGLTTTCVELNKYRKADSILKEVTPLFTQNQPIDSIVKNMDYFTMLDLFLFYGNEIYANTKNPQPTISGDSLISIFNNAYKMSLSIFTRFDFSSLAILDQTSELRTFANSIMLSNQISKFSNKQLKTFWFISSTLKSFDLVNQKYTKNINEELNNRYRELTLLMAQSKNDEKMHQIYFDQYIDFCLKHQINSLRRYENPYDANDLIESYTNTEKLFDIDDNRLILDFYQTEESIDVFAIHNGDLKRKTIETDQEVQKALKQIKKDIKTGNHNSNLAFQTFEKSFADLLNEYPSTTKITIILDQELHYIPFEMLQYKNKPIVYNYEVSYNYSPYLVYESYIKTKYKTDNILTVAPGFGDQKNQNLFALRSFLEEMDETETIHELYRDGSTLCSLPFAAMEVETINNLAKSTQKNVTTLIGKEATEGAFRKMAPNNQIIHLATHGFSSGSDPSLSRLIFTENQENDSIKQNDSFLFYNETFELNLNAELLVLSACKSGTGKVFDTEGIAALPKGFIYAGIPNVIGSMWKVHDKKTKDMMVSFYTYLLKDGYTYSKALQKAKTDAIEDGYLPIDWAGFILIGN